MSEYESALWDVFGDCETCGAIEKEACINLRKSNTSLGILIECTMPHKGRPFLKKKGK